MYSESVAQGDRRRVGHQRGARRGATEQRVDRIDGTQRVQAVMTARPTKGRRSRGNHRATLYSAARALYTAKCTGALYVVHGTPRATHSAGATASSSQRHIASGVADRCPRDIRCQTRRSHAVCAMRRNGTSGTCTPCHQSHVGLRVRVPHQACATHCTVPPGGNASNSAEPAGCSTTPPHRTTWSRHQRPSSRSPGSGFAWCRHARLHDRQGGCAITGRPPPNVRASRRAVYASTASECQADEGDTQRTAARGSMHPPYSSRPRGQASK